MVQQTAVRAYRMKPMTPEVRDKVNLSYAESLDLRERELKCPHCGRYIASCFQTAPATSS